MARECQICGKAGLMSYRRNKLRGKFNPVKKKRKQQPNLQWVSIPLGIKKKDFKQFSGKRLLACTKCRRTLLKK